MAGATAVVADDMKERLQLYLNETNDSVLTALRIGWKDYTGYGGLALFGAQRMGGKLVRAKEVLERFGDSWEEWVVTRSEMGIVPFSFEQAERLIELHELGDRIRSDGKAEAAEFTAILAARASGKA